MDKYDVFISYSRKDYVDEKGNVIPDNVVSKIKDALSSAEITYWFDEDGIYHGNDFAEKIVTNIEAADIFIFISTTNSNNSDWTKKEIACAYEMNKIIIPVRIDRSKYNRSVLLRISDLDYLDYAKNPEKGINDLVESVKIYRSEKQEQKQKDVKQQEEIQETELLIKKLKAEEYTLDVSRDDLIVRIQRLDDEEEKNRLLRLVDDNSQTSVKIKEKDSRISELEKENQKLRNKMRGMSVSDTTRRNFNVTLLIISVLLLITLFFIFRLVNVNKSNKIEMESNKIEMESNKIEMESNKIEIDDKNDTIAILKAEVKKLNTKINIFKKYVVTTRQDAQDQICIVNNHEYVDLGLPSGLKWATCNIGANKPEEYGDYFAWGEVETKDEYTDENSLTLDKYITDISGAIKYDAATANWGGTWRMPTEAEFNELLDNCLWVWGSLSNGKSGYTIIGPNGNSVFLPAAGKLEGMSKSKIRSGLSGCYWSSTPSKNGAYNLYFNGDEEYVDYYSRYYGFTVRPITE